MVLEQPEDHGHGLGEHGQHERDRQGEGERGQHVLAHDGVAAAGQAEGAGVDGRAQPAAEGAEDVAPHPDGGGHEHQQPRKLLEGAGDGAEGQSGEEVTARGDGEGGQALPGGRCVRSDERAKPGADTAKAASHGNSGVPPSDWPP